jgi:hypothetical protein
MCSNATLVLVDFHVRPNQVDLQKGMETLQAIHIRKIPKGIVHRPSRQIYRKTSKKVMQDPIPEMRELFIFHGSSPV